MERAAAGVVRRAARGKTVTWRGNAEQASNIVRMVAKVETNEGFEALSWFER